MPGYEVSRWLAVIDEMDQKIRMSSVRIRMSSVRIRMSSVRIRMSSVKSVICDIPDEPMARIYDKNFLFSMMGFA